MNSDVLDFIDEIYTLKHIIRYNTIAKITQESVAEHTFFVSAIVLRLHRTYVFDLGKALQMAIVHDLIETFISDIPRNVKDKYSKLNSVLEEVERDAWTDLYPEYADLMDELEKGITIESIIVKMADILSVIQYAKSEKALGNVKEMDIILKNGNKRMDSLLIKLKKVTNNGIY